MTDARELNGEMSTEEKLERIRQISSRLYRDVPILMTAAQAAEMTPPKYREMRKIAINAAAYRREPEAKIFYEQGKFMEGFEDDFDYQGSFTRYFPTYQGLTDLQLRGYFSWRTRLRRGNLEKASLSFAFMYIYELLNGIGARSPEEGYRALTDFRTDYGQLDAQIEPYLRLWLNDYIVYYNLDRSLLKDVTDVSFDETILTLLDCRTKDAGEAGADELDKAFTALNALSSYNLANSPFFRRYPEDVKRVAYGAFSALSKRYAKRRANQEGVQEQFLGKICTYPHAMFQSAVFYDRLDRRDYLYEVNEICRYRCRDGSWTSERFFGFRGKIKRIGVLLKAVDFLMRRRYNFKSTLKVDKLTQTYRTAIEREIESLLERRRERAQPRVEIDVSKLPQIRRAALATQDKLIVAESQDAAPQAADPAGSEPAKPTALSGVERRFLKRLLDGQPYEDLLRPLNLMPSLMVEAVNEKLYETFGDTVIAYDGDRPEPIGDYMDKLRGIAEG